MELFPARPHLRDLTVAISESDVFASIENIFCVCVAGKCCGLLWLFFVGVIVGDQIRKFGKPKRRKEENDGKAGKKKKRKVNKMIPNARDK